MTIWSAFDVLTKLEMCSVFVFHVSHLNLNRPDTQIVQMLFNHLWAHGKTLNWYNLREFQSTSNLAPAGVCLIVRICINWFERTGDDKRWKCFGVRC